MTDKEFEPRTTAVWETLATRETDLTRRVRGRPGEDVQKRVDNGRDVSEGTDRVNFDVCERVVLDFQDVYKG